MLQQAGYDIREPLFVTAQPAGLDAGSFRQQPCAQVPGPPMTAGS